LEICPEIESYPVFFFELASSNEDMRKVITNHTREIRGILTGDLNWKMKKKSIYEKILDNDCSSRDSSIWLMASRGTFKVISNQFGTPTERSNVLAVFELEILLTLKFALNRINYNLSTVSEQKWDISILSELRDDVIRKIDKFYNINISHKDTTIARMEKGKNILNINYIYKATMNKFHSLDRRLDSLYQASSHRQKIWLTALLGVFGVGSLIFDLTYLIFTDVPTFTKISVIGLSFAAVVTLIALLYKHLNLRGGNDN